MKTLPNLPDIKSSRATFSHCKAYRYVLYKSASDTETPSVLWIMLNPSTADQNRDDPTVRKCQGFSRKWGFQAVTVVNLFAFRSTDPKGICLSVNSDPIGPDNRDTLDMGLIHPSTERSGHRLR